jgi:hypothetical protein
MKERHPASPATEQSRYFLLGCFPRADHKAPALAKLHKHRKERSFLSRESRRWFAHIPPQNTGLSYLDWGQNTSSTNSKK